MSKMQEILDDAKAQWERGNSTGTIDRLIEAIELLSRGQQQVMGDIAKEKNRYHDDIPIGGDPNARSQRPQRTHP